MYQLNKLLPTNIMEQPNIDYIEKVSYKSPEFKDKIIQIIKEELPIEINLYRQYISVQDYTLAANMVHKLKHKIGVFGFHKGYLLAQSFEDNLREGKVVNQSDFEKILMKMEDFVNKM